MGKTRIQIEYQSHFRAIIDNLFTPRIHQKTRASRPGDHHHPEVLGKLETHLSNA